MTLWRDARWRGVVAGFVLNGLLFGAWAARVPAFKDRLALEPSALGLLLLALAGGAICAFPFAGRACEKWGEKRLTMLSACAYIPALILLAMAPSALTLGAALLVFGAAHGTMDVAMNGWGARVETDLGRSIMPFFHAMFSLGAGLGAASGVLAARFEIAPPGHFAPVAILGGLAALAVMRAAPDLPAAPATSPAPLFALPSGALCLVGLIGFAAALGEGAVTDWSAVFLLLVTQVSESRAALGYAIFSLMMVITRLMGGQIVARLGPVLTTRASAGCACLGLVMLMLSSHLGLALLGFALIGMGYAIVIPLVFSRAAADPNMPPGPAIASMALFTYGGMLLGPPLIGFAAQGVGMRLSFVILLGLSALAMALAGRLRAP